MRRSRGKLSGMVFEGESQFCEKWSPTCTQSYNEAGQKEISQARYLRESRISIKGGHHVGGCGRSSSRHALAESREDTVSAPAHSFPNTFKVLMTNLCY